MSISKRACPRGKRTPLEQWLRGLVVLPQEGSYPGGHESEMMMRECIFYETFVSIKHESVHFYSIKFNSFLFESM